MPHDNLDGVKLPRQCCRPGCSRSAVATLTFVYSESTAVIGPLASSDEPHSWDLCEEHAHRITVPRGWEMLRSERGFSAPVAEDYELTALAEAVREVNGRSTARPGRRLSTERSAREPALFDEADLIDDLPAGRHRRGAPGSTPTSTPTPEDVLRNQFGRPRPGRRGHLRVLPDPVD